jgi:hypothetical protein
MLYADIKNINLWDRFDNLKKIKFNDDFNQEINNLSNSITHLSFGRFFNQEVNNLPNLLTHLLFEFNF